MAVNDVFHRLLVDDFEQDCHGDASTDPAPIPPALAAAIPGLEAAIQADGQLIP